MDVSVLLQNALQWELEGTRVFSSAVLFPMALIFSGVFMFLWGTRQFKAIREFKISREDAENVLLVTICGPALALIGCLHWSDTVGAKEGTNADSALAFILPVLAVSAAVLMHLILLKLQAKRAITVER